MESVDIHCSALCTAKNRNLSLPTSTDVSTPFRFVIIADPQLGLLEQYVEKRPRPHHWDREVKLVSRAVSIINRLCPKPAFVIICGDLVNEHPGGSDRCKQTSDLLDILSHLNSDIPLIVLPGNHDVGNRPDVNDVQDYISMWGDDYFTFIFNRTRFIVLNTQYLVNDSKCQSSSSEFRQWFNEQLSIKNENFDMSVVFQCFARTFWSYISIFFKTSHFTYLRHFPWSDHNMYYEVLPGVIGYLSQIVVFDSILK
ncbi:unnamed protein product [Schistosoma bovis]|nr:unnamed protein product [Schistosoma bovis]